MITDAIVVMWANTKDLMFWEAWAKTTLQCGEILFTLPGTGPKAVETRTSIYYLYERLYSKDTG